jgi:hypothetical protein
VLQGDLLRLVNRYIHEPMRQQKTLHLPDVMMVVGFVLMFAGFLRYSDVTSILVHEDFIVFGGDRRHSLRIVAPLIRQ